MFSFDLKNIFIETMLQIESNTTGKITFEWSMQSLHIQDPSVLVNNMQMMKKILSYVGVSTSEYCFKYLKIKIL